MTVYHMSLGAVVEMVSFQGTPDGPAPLSGAEARACVSDVVSATLRPLLAKAGVDLRTITITSADDEEVGR